MARTPLVGWLQEAAGIAAEAASRNVDTGKVIAERVERRGLPLALLRWVRGRRRPPVALGSWWWVLGWPG